MPIISKQMPNYGTQFCDFCFIERQELDESERSRERSVTDLAAAKRSLEILRQEGAAELDEARLNLLYIVCQLTSLAFCNGAPMRKIG